VGRAVAGHTEVSFAAATTGPANLMAAVACRDDRALYRYLTDASAPSTACGTWRRPR
jgi:hypothetical protein